MPDRVHLVLVKTGKLAPDVSEVKTACDMELVNVEILTTYDPRYAVCQSCQDVMDSHGDILAENYPFENVYAVMGDDPDEK